MNNHTKPNSRRKFLLNASLGGAGAAVAVVAGRKVASGAQSGAAAGESRGYHVSEHILKYYKTTQV
ncbi:MAG TPA: formate dehydrogenase [Usitatibacteraceae bacterium]|nr:formate dehydrogenase [Usitatibacteraceae bacterium]